jgi:hypothetical protein
MSFARSNEIASASQIASNVEENERFKSRAKGVLGAATGLVGGGAALGSKLGSRILPFLNQYISPDMAMKGISKISPELGSFLKNGMKSGLDLKSGLDFLKEKLSPQEEKKKDPMELISGYSPELAQFIQGHIKNGRSPKEAAALAKVSTPHGKSVKDIEKQTKENFVDMVERLLGSSASQAPSQQAQQPQQQSQPQQMISPQQGQQQGQGGPGQAALMAILQKINQRTGQ